MSEWLNGRPLITALRTSTCARTQKRPSASELVRVQANDAQQAARPHFRRPTTTSLLTRLLLHRHPSNRATRTRSNICCLANNNSSIARCCSLFLFCRPDTPPCPLCLRAGSEQAPCVCVCVSHFCSFSLFVCCDCCARKLKTSELRLVVVFVLRLRNVRLCAKLGQRRTHSCSLAFAVCVCVQ